MRIFLVVLFGLAIQLLSAQEKPFPASKKTDSLALSPKNAQGAQKEGPNIIEIGIEDYKIISHDRDTTYLDTTLTIQKEYRYNYLRKDDFELMPFANVARPYNSLGLSLERKQLYPRMGATARHFNYKEIEDIRYFNVPTPMSDLFFKTTFEQGQMLDALLTFNTSKRLNFSIAYMGTRSLGKYRNTEAQSGNFRTTANYITRNGKYRFMAHIAAQDMDSEENGGLLDKEAQFESGDSNFDNRSSIDVVLSGVNNKLLGKRYFLNHEYELFGSAKDSTSGRRTNLVVGHQFAYETKYYQYSQSGTTGYFGDLIASPINDKAYLKTFFNQLSLGFSNRILGNIRGYVNWYNYDYYFKSLLITDAQTISNQLQGEELTLGGTYKNTIGRFRLKGNGGLTLVGDLTSSFLDAEASIGLGEKHRLSAGLHTSTRMPDFNFLLYQSDYANYNWDNSSVFENEKVYSLRFGLNSDWFGNWEARFATVDNYTYFTSTASEAEIEAGNELDFVRPFQEGGSITFLKVKAEKEFKWRKWALNNTVMYQQVGQDNNVMNVPELVTRNTLYFSSNIFKKAMYLQTGVTFKYFTPYTMNAYNPLLAEFYVQDREELGGFPMLDFFINAKVRQTRIYLKAEHFNSSFTGYNYYSAPGYPYRDFVVRFGLVWNFFS